MKCKYCGKDMVLLSQEKDVNRYFCEDAFKNTNTHSAVDVYSNGEQRWWKKGD